MERTGQSPATQLFSFRDQILKVQSEDEDVCDRNPDPGGGFETTQGAPGWFIALQRSTGISGTSVISV
jgi:hypothetical protein